MWFSVHKFVCSWAVVRFLVFIFPCVFLPCRITSNLHVCLGLALFVFVGFVGDFQFFNFPVFFRLRMMCARTWFKISSRSVVPKNARIFTLKTSAHLFAAVVPLLEDTGGNGPEQIANMAQGFRVIAIPQSYGFPPYFYQKTFVFAVFLRTFCFKLNI